MNRDGKLRAWGDADFARKLVEFANIEVIPEPRRARRGPGASCSELFGPRPYDYWGAAEARRTTRRT